MTSQAAQPDLLCPNNCGFPLDLQQKTPAVWWCGWCYIFYDGDLQALPNKWANQARTRPARPIAIKSIPIDNGIQDDQPED